MVCDVPGGCVPSAKLSHHNFQRVPQPAVIDGDGNGPRRNPMSAKADPESLRSARDDFGQDFVRAQAGSVVEDRRDHHHLVDARQFDEPLDAVANGVG